MAVGSVRQRSNFRALTAISKSTGCSKSTGRAGGGKY